MKNQYFGDINDYRKYGLLRIIQARGDKTLLVAWMLTPNDPSRDGKFRSYLDAPNRFAGFDPGLFAFLSSVPSLCQAPAVTHMERSGLLARTRFYSSHVPDDTEERAIWRRGLLRAAQDVDLVFLDPDNGIEVRSRPMGRKGSSKHVAWSELAMLWEQDCSLLIYQHFPRKRHAEYANERAQELRVNLGARRVEALKAGNVLFLLVSSDRHSEWLRFVASRIDRSWSGQIARMAVG